MTMRDYPHLPILTIPQCLAAFDLAGIESGKLHTLIGVSRMTVYKWRTRGTTPYSHTLQAVSTLAYKALRAVKAGLLPPPPHAELEEVQKVLSDADERMELLDNLSADDLLSVLPTKT